MPKKMSSDIDRVLKQAKYGPIPPPISSPEIYISRRAGTWDLGDYRGGYGPVFLPGPKTEVIDKQGLELSHNFGENPKEDPRKIWSRILAYLSTQNVSVEEASWYLDQIFREGLTLPNQTILQETIDRWTAHPQKLEQDLVIFGESGNRLGLIIPKHLLITRGLPYFFFTSIYWFRPPIGVSAPRELYLITANPYERYPARKYLSHFKDPELYLRFGRTDNYYFPAVYSTKRQQLDGLVAFCLSTYGYYSVRSWSRPIQIILNRPRTTIPLITEIDQELVSLEEIMRRPDIQALRLHMMVESSWPQLKDREAWTQFLEWGRETLYSGPSASLLGERLPLIQSEQVRDQFRSLEQNSDLCLVCQNIRPDQELALCGDPICSTCQALLGTVRCPFCNEYFVCESIGDPFIRSLRSPIKSGLDLRGRIEQIKREKQERSPVGQFASG